MMSYKLTAVFLIFCGSSVYGMVQGVTDVTGGAKGDSFGGVAALILGTAGLAALNLWKNYQMTVLTVRSARDKVDQEREIESRKAEMSSFQDRLKKQDEYIEILQAKLLVTSEERVQWKTLCESLKPTAVTVQPSLAPRIESQ